LSSVLRYALALGLAVLAPAECIGAQDTSAAGAVRDLRVFLDCNANCDRDYMRSETPWVAFVRDRTDADVHLLITSLGTGGGGQEYTLNFLGLGSFEGRNDTLRFVAHPGDTDDVARMGLTRTIQLGLAPYVARSPAGARLRMVLDDDRGGGRVARAAPADDPWRAWVFEIEAEGSLEKEQRQAEFEWGGSLDARRITDRWKFGVSADASFDETRFTIDDEEEGEPAREIVNVRENYSGGAVLVRSHGAHWGSGFQVSLSSSTFSNTRFALRAAPAVEYSVFPYGDFTRRQLTVQYSVGVSSFRYREETIFGRMQETRPTHALVVGYDVNQPWGTAELTLESARYIDNGSQWRVELDSEFEIRITRGLAVEIGANASLIRDQLAIAARDATPEEILLELRDLQTDYEYRLNVGLSYTFGSIFSSVINPRFGTGPGEVLR
jgi:hypothetical protein